MKSKLIAIVAVAAGLSLGLAGTASASALGQPKHHHPKPKPKAVTQVTGKQLRGALLPGSAFGVGDTTSGETDTGSHLISSQGNVASYGCGDIILGIPIAGQTAAAADIVNSGGDGLGAQAISQFANNGSAWSYYGQLENKYKSCVTFSTSDPGSAQTGTISLSFDLQTVSGTKVGSNYAFTVTEVVELSDSLTDTTESLNATVVSNGRDVYTIWEINQASSPIPNSLLSSLMNRTRALYKG
jgi:hypothetical protein